MKKKLLKIFAPLISAYHLLLSFLGALFYGFPSKKMKVIGVTGTNGKSTTVELIAAILREAGYATAYTSSIKFDIKGKERPNLLKMTMPGRAALQKFLSEAVNSGCQYVVLEVSSEGIKQHRHRFIKFHTAVITNISKEHIESHGGFENYKKAKGELFRVAKEKHIINLDDEHKDFFWDIPAKEKIGYAIKNKEASFLGEDVRADTTGVCFNFRGEEVFTPLKGDFNAYNVLASVATALSEGVKIETVKKALQKVKLIPGRMEEVVSSPFRVIVDYAVTPDALSSTYQTVRKHYLPSKMICVLGSCGGGRDKWKRPVMGRIASDSCDEVIVTNEDPYDEDEAGIIEDIISGTSQKAEKIIDRREAIRAALLKARKGDAVVVTGKGCEVWMCLSGGRKIPWDDRKVIREEFEKIKLIGKIL